MGAVRTLAFRTANIEPEPEQGAQALALHFSIEEYTTRRAETCRRLAERDLDGLLLFRQESMYYLTGYDTQGFVMFRGMYLSCGDLFDTHARVFEGAGYGHAYLNACGDTMNANYAPSWMSSPMLYTGNPQALAPGMVFFTHMILLDDRTGLSMSLGETAVVTEGDCRPLTHPPREPVVN